jgi:hypothetical protein
MYLKMVRLVAALVTPLLVVLALVADPLTVGLLGEKWQPAILPLQLMVLAGISRSAIGLYACKCRGEVLYLDQQRKDQKRGKMRAHFADRARPHVQEK